MVGIFELVFDDYISTGSFLLGEDVNTEIADIRLFFLKGNVDADGLTK